MDALTNCTGLQVLDLGDNQLQGFIPSSVGNLSSDLFFFSLQNNPISGNIAADIGKLTGLTRIQLSNILKTILPGTRSVQEPGLYVCTTHACTAWSQSYFIR